MPITKSAKKALRQSKKRRERNLRRLNAMREIIKQIRKLVIENKKEEALKLLPIAYKTIDKAAKTNVIKKNTAARKKSRLTKLISKTQVKQPTPVPPSPAPPASPAGGSADDKSKDLPETIPKQS
jgi:small subunit ribosomal protein S20